MIDIWESRWNKMKEWLENEYGKWELIKDYPSVPLTLSTLSVVHDMMERIEKQ